MGTRTNFHVGAYLEIKVKSIEEQECVRYCPNHRFVTFGNRDKFCSICGTLIISKFEPKTKYPELWDIFGDLELDDEPLQDIDIVDNEENKNKIIAINNLSAIGSELDEDEMDNTIFEITPKTISECLDIFEAKHGKLIEKIREVDFVESIELKFGAGIWY